MSPFLLSLGGSPRIVVQATPREKRRIAAKARRLGIETSALMLRGASAYEPSQADDHLLVVADAAKAAAERASASVDQALAFIHASNKRIASP